MSEENRNPWSAFVKWLAGPAEAEADKLGVEKDRRNAFAHAYTAARMTHGAQGAPIYRGRPAAASDLIDFLGRQKENLPGLFGRQDDFRDYYRDLWNNGVGIDIANYARHNLYSQGELGKLVKDALDDGTIISSLTDQRIPSRPSGGYFSWPVPSPPQYQGPSYRGPVPQATDQPVSAFDRGAPPVPFLSPPQDAPGGLVGMMARTGVIDPSNPNPPPPGGLAALVQDYLRNSPQRGN